MNYLKTSDAITYPGLENAQVDSNAALPPLPTKIYPSGEVYENGTQIDPNAGRDVSDFTAADQVRAFDDMREKADKGYFPGLEKLPSYLGGIGGLINAGTKNIAGSVVDNFNRGFAPTYGKKGEDRQGNITGTSDYGIGMGMPSSDKNMEQGPFGNFFGTGKTVPGYDVFDATSP